MFTTLRNNSRFQQIIRQSFHAVADSGRVNLFYCRLRESHFFLLQSPGGSIIPVADFGWVNS